MDTFTFDEANHEYALNGKKYDSCTGVLNIIAKPALIPWAAGEAVNYIEENCSFIEPIEEITTPHYFVTKEDLKKAKSAHRKKKENAADWGTIVHKAIEVWINTKAVPSTVDLMGVNTILLEEHLTAIGNFIKWASENNVEFLISEKKIYSKEWELGGTVDFVCNIDGRLYIGDLKTSSGIYESYFLQTAAYGKMMMEMGLFTHFDHMVIVNCKKDGTIDTEVRKDVEGNIKCFEAALMLHNRFKK